jgi:hypothetical protein
MSIRALAGIGISEKSAKDGWRVSFGSLLLDGVMRVPEHPARRETARMGAMTRGSLALGKLSRRTAKALFLRPFQAQEAKPIASPLGAESI